MSRYDSKVPKFLSLEENRRSRQKTFDSLSISHLFPLPKAGYSREGKRRNLDVLPRDDFAQTTFSQFFVLAHCKTMDGVISQSSATR